MTDAHDDAVPTHAVPTQAVLTPAEPTQAEVDALRRRRAVRTLVLSVVVIVIGCGLFYLGGRFPTGSGRQALLGWLAVIAVLGGFAVGISAALRARLFARGRRP